MRSRRSILKLAAAGAAAYAAPAKSSVGFLFAGRHRIYTVGKRTTLFITGASDAWGVGLDQTQHYATIMQSAVDANPITGSRAKGGWTARCLHADDIQPGLGTVGGFVLNPFNLSGAGGNNGSWTVPNINIPQGYNGGTGWYYDAWQNVTYAQGPNINPQGGYYSTTTPHNTPTSSKLDFTLAGGGTLLSAAQTGLFSAFSGYKTPAPGPPGPYAAPGLEFTASGNNLRWAANMSLSANLIAVGVICLSAGSAYVYCGGSSPTLVETIGFSPTIPLSVQQFIVGPFSSTPGVQTCSIYWASGDFILSHLWPANNSQNTTDLSVQLCARDSHCIQDFIGNWDSGTSTFPGATDPTSNGGLITDYMKQSVVNNSNYPGSAKPYFLLQDTTANFIIGASGSAPDRRLPPGTVGVPGNDYVTALQTMGEALESGPLGGNIILEMPCECLPPSAPFAAGGSGIGYLSSLGGTNHSAQLAYRQAIAALAAYKGWLFLDQTPLPSITDPNFFQEDGLHMQVHGSSLTANYNIEQLGL